MRRVEGLGAKDAVGECEELSHDRSNDDLFVLACA
jgi:hypothetical protein